MLAVHAACGFAHAQAAPDATSPTEAAALQLARTFETAFATRRFEPVLTAFDERALFDRVMHGLPVTDEHRNRWAGVDGMLSRMITKQLAATLGARGSLRLLGTGAAPDGSTHARFRLVSSTGVLGYYDLVIADDHGDADGPTIVDIVMHSRGEPMSQTLRRAMLPRIMRTEPEWKDKLGEMERTFVKHLGKINQMYAIRGTDKPEAALAIYGRLPDPLGVERSILLDAIEWGAETGSAELTAALVNRYRAAHADPLGRSALALHTLRRSVEAKDWAAALEAVEQLDKLVGGDAYLHLYRGRVAAESGKADEALAHYEQAAAGAPDVAEVYYPLIDAALARADFPATTKWLLAAERNAGVVFGDLTTTDGFAAYVASPEYPTWRDRKK